LSFVPDAEQRLRRTGEGSGRLAHHCVSQHDSAEV